MFCLRISLTIAAIDTIKAHLLRALPQVKSSHRVEAAARGFGFQTNAAMRAAVKYRDDVLVEVQWEPFASYLEEHGVEADPSHLCHACAGVAVQGVLRRFPRLTMFGFETGRLERNPDGTKETMEQYRERVRQSRQDLIDEYGAKEFLLSLALLARVKRIKVISASNSYWVKHIAENFPCTYPHGLKLGPTYVANGALIAAAAHAGFTVRPIPDTPNALFNMSNGDLKALDSEVRGRGASAQTRRRQQQTMKSAPHAQSETLRGT